MKNSNFYCGMKNYITSKEIIFINSMFANSDWKLNSKKLLINSNILFFNFSSIMVELIGLFINNITLVNSDLISNTHRCKSEFPYQLKPLLNPFKNYSKEGHIFNLSNLVRMYNSTSEFSLLELFLLKNYTTIIFSELSILQKSVVSGSNIGYYSNSLLMSVYSELTSSGLGCKLNNGIGGGTQDIICKFTKNLFQFFFIYFIHLLKFQLFFLNLLINFKSIEKSIISY